jgi:hypothetical protein
MSSHHIHNEIQEENKGCSITYIRLLALPRTGTKTLHIRFPAGQSHARMARMRTHTGPRGFTSVRAPGIRLAVDGKASGRLVSAQLWRHPSHAHILQGSRDQLLAGLPPARQPRPHPAAAHAQPPVLLGGSIIRSHLHLHASIRSRAHMHARCLEPAAGRLASITRGSRPVASSSARASGLWPRSLGQATARRMGVRHVG